MNANESFEIAIYDLEGNFVTQVYGNKLASALTGASRASISACISGSIVQAANFQFRKIKEDAMRNVGDVSRIQGGHDPQPVSKYFNGRLICIYKSCKEAGDKNGIERSSVRNSCLNGHKAGIYNFKFIG